MQTRTFAISLALLIPLASTAAAASSTAAIITTIRGAIGAANADDATKVNSYFTPVSDVVDDFAPYHWGGSNAAAAWWSALNRVNGAMHVTGIHATILTVAQLRVSGDNAYAVVPLSISYLLKGKAGRERGLWTLTLRRSGVLWKIATAAYADESRS
jgi:ketosteroid isomerase-like protein